MILLEVKRPGLVWGPSQSQPELTFQLDFVWNQSGRICMNSYHSCLHTSMRNDSFVWLNAFHVNEMLLLSDGDAPPHPVVTAHVLSSWLRSCTQVGLLWFPCLPQEDSNRLLLQFLQVLFFFFFVALKWPCRSASSGVSSSSTLTSRSSPVSSASSSVSRASSDRREPSLCSGDRSAGGENHSRFWWDPAGRSADKEGFCQSSCQSVGHLSTSVHFKFYNFKEISLPYTFVNHLILFIYLLCGPSAQKPH